MEVVYTWRRREGRVRPEALREEEEDAGGNLDLRVGWGEWLFCGVVFRLVEVLKISISGLSRLLPVRRLTGLRFSFKYSV